jgi:hypothetical protein
MEYNNWYILQGLFNVDINVNGTWKFFQFEIRNFNKDTNRVNLVHENGNSLELVLDFTKIDQYYVKTCNKVNIFKEYLNSGKWVSVRKFDII